MQSLCLLSKCCFRWADFIDSLTNVSWHKTQWGFGASHQSKKPLLQVVEAVFPFWTACRIFLLCLTLSVCPCTGVRLARRARATSTGCGSDIISGNQSHVSTSNDVSRRMLGFRIFCVLSASSSVGFLGSVNISVFIPCISGFIPRFSCFWATDPNSSAQLTLDVAAWPGWPICFDSSRECASCRHAPEVRGCHSLFTCVFFCC